MDNEQVVNAPVTTELPSDGTSEVVVPEETPPSTQAGDKTPPNLLLKSLQEERERRRLLEEELNQLKSSALLNEDEVVSDEGKILRNQISALKSEISDIKTESTKKDILLTYPILKEKWSEFEEFQTNPDNKGMNLRTAVKAFLIENGFLDTPRKGLEKSTGGPRIPPSSGMTVDDVKTLRETNFKKYQDMLLKGQIKIE